jgi:hypothetical protein
MVKLADEVRKLGAKFNGIAEGVYLPHDCCHVQLTTCWRCHGEGEVSCLSCGGDGETTCPVCHGRGGDRCVVCSGGTTLCNQCNGSGRYSQVVNGQYVSAPCGCLNGQQICISCSGSGTVSCGKCRGYGQLKCSACHGSGKQTCGLCEGSRRAGKVAWTDVRVEPRYTFSFARKAPDDVEAIRELHKELEEFVSLSEQFTQVSATDNAKGSVATYTGVFAVHRLQVTCHGEIFNLVGYGNEIRWWTLDHLIEQLLEDDLENLRSAIVDAKAVGSMEGRAQKILVTLKNVLRSEINADLVDLAIGIRKKRELKDAASEKYEIFLKSSVISALDKLSTIQRQSLLRILVPVGIVVGWVSWLAARPVWMASVLAIILAIVAVVLHRSLLTKQLSGLLGKADAGARFVTMHEKDTAPLELWKMRAKLALWPALAVIAVGYYSPKNQQAPRLEAAPAASTSLTNDAAVNSKTQSPAAQASPQPAASTTVSASVPAPLVPPSQVAEDLYKKGENAIKKLEFERAFSFFNKASDYGHLPARTRVADMLFQGKGVRENIPKAADLLQSAADEGYARAQRLVAKHFYVGNYGRRQDPSQALKYAVKAADQGDKDAQYLAAKIFSEGPQTSWQMACKYARQAEGQGVVEAGQLARKTCRA